MDIVTAFSRVEGERRVYVQDRVGERSARVMELLEQGASLYVCGKAGMAREVDAKIEEAGRRGGKSEGDVREWVEGLKRRGKWRADVWG